MTFQNNLSVKPGGLRVHLFGHKKAGCLEACCDIDNVWTLDANVSVPIGAHWIEFHAVD